MTIVEMLTKYPYLFYGQSWYRGEAFTRVLPVSPIYDPPSGLSFIGKTPPPNAKLPHAVDLLGAFIRHPDAAIWNSYLWTASVDGSGQRIYIGGFSNTGALEIHRHLHITERFGVPLWQ